MPKRATVIIDEDVYEKLVEESLKRYGSTKAILRVLNEELRWSLGGEKKSLSSSIPKE